MTNAASQAADRLTRIVGELRRNIDTAKRGVAQPNNKPLVAEAQGLLKEIARAH